MIVGGTCENSKKVMCDVEPPVHMYVQWNLSTKDALGPANLSTVKRLSTLQRWECNSTIVKVIVIMTSIIVI